MESKLLKTLIDDLYEGGYITHKDYKKHIKENNLFPVTDEILLRGWDNAEELKLSPNIKQLQNSSNFLNIKHGTAVANKDIILKTPTEIQAFIELWRLQNYAKFWGNRYPTIIKSESDPAEQTTLDYTCFSLAEVHEVTKKFFWTADMINEAYSMPMPEHNVTENLVDDDTGYFFIFEKPVRLEGVDGTYHIRSLSILTAKEGLTITNDSFDRVKLEFDKESGPIIVKDGREGQATTNLPYGAEYPKDFWLEKSPNWGTLVMSLLNFLRSTATITKKGRNTRAEIRRAKKQGIKLQKADTDINIVYLRPTKYEYEKNDNEPTRKNKSYKGRFNVRGHWRNYWVGKGRNRRELRYVQGFQKGSGNLINKIHIVNN
jgi:hypothetical protein